MTTTQIPPGGMPEERKWETQDGAECARLVREMSDDAKLQFQVFTFSLAATAVLLGVLAPPTGGNKNILEHLGESNPLAFLAPLIVLIPSSLMILNRARTRNRKSAYMVCYLDRKRLYIAGVQDSTPLAEVRGRNDLPWETGLHILQRKAPHPAPTLKYMGFCQLAAEVLCFALAGVSLYRQVKTIFAEPPPPPATVAILTLFGMFFLLCLLAWFALFLFRWNKYQRLACEESIQGFVQSWLTEADENKANWPKYLDQYLAHCNLPAPRRQR